MGTGQATSPMLDHTKAPGPDAARCDSHRTHTVSAPALIRSNATVAIARGGCTTCSAVRHPKRGRARRPGSPSRMSVAPLRVWCPAVLSATVRDASWQRRHRSGPESAAGTRGCTVRLRVSRSAIGAGGAAVRPWSALNLTVRFAGVAGLVLTAVMTAGAAPAVADATTIGPVFPAPGSGTWTSTGTPAGGEIGKAGGITWSYTGVDPTQFDQMVWGLGYPAFPATFSFGLDTATLAFDPASSDLAAGSSTSPGPRSSRTWTAARPVTRSGCR